MRPLFAPDDLTEVRRFYSQTQAPATPLVELPALAREVGAGRILVKDESARFGLPAFKIVGVRYAVARVLASAQEPVPALGAATAGNHGRAVARAARDHGLTAHIFVPAGTTPARIDALRHEGAAVTVTRVAYDDTVRMLAAEAQIRGWTIVSDTAWPGYEDVPRWIMAGYTHILDEVAAAGGFAGDLQKMLVIVQAGVGSLAGAVAGWLEATFGAHRPRLVVVEPEGSACVGVSLRVGVRTALPEAAPTSMVGLRCAEVSTVAWPILQAMVDTAVTVTDAQVDAAIDRLARPLPGDPVVRSGPSGAAGVAALLAWQGLPHLAGHTVLVINTEGPLAG